MKKDLRVKALANEAARKIKVLTDIHQTQIESIYQQFREQAAKIQGSNADSLVGSNVTPIPSPTHELGDSHDFTP